MSEEGQVEAPTAKEIAEYLVNDWLMREGVALTGVRGEVPRHQISAFKISLRNRITTALSAAEQRGRNEQREKDARLAQTMATGEDVTTGRLKAINIAAAIREHQE